MLDVVRALREIHITIRICDSKVDFATSGAVTNTGNKVNRRLTWTLLSLILFCTLLLLAIVLI